jgi:hypothetical protein
MRAEYLQVAKAAVVACLAASLEACDTQPQTALPYLDPHSVVFGRTVDELEKQFGRSGYRVVFQTLETTNSHWLVASTFPYRGRDMFDVYVFEKPHSGGYGGDYTLRSMLLVYNSEHLNAEFKSERGGVAVFQGSRMLSWIGPRDSVKPEKGQAVN